ncbi:polysaccharide deacetylase family protein [Bacillus sp. REN10]|uniref:polysaccharide deacetylase family protein n=1 Tax=Bacillus sp. REN10 TaxID=2782541 RepID=UPI00193B1F5D|nr:polysaccharide deacetylase family protein [Bacillus sp. REN10]
MKAREKRKNGNIRLLMMIVVLLFTSFSLATYHLIQKKQAVALAEQKEIEKQEQVKREKEQAKREAEEAQRKKEEEERQKFPQIAPAPVIPAEEKTVYLTFDDGPFDVSMQILDLLDKYNAKATFFMLEPNIRKHPQAVQEMVKRGHAIGMHGVTHDVKQVYRSADSVASEMKAGQQAIKEITGYETHLIRTPYGSFPHMKPNYKQKVNEAGFKMWDWTVDSLDWKFRSPAYVNHVINHLSPAKAQSRGEIILLHEKPATAQSLANLLKYLQDNGYAMRALNENTEPYQLRP